MSQTKVKKLTPEQAALIPVYREKWRAISLSTGPINRSQAAETVKSAYSAIGKKAPEIIFVDRPYEAADIIVSQIDNPRSQLRSQFETKLRSPLEKKLRGYLGSQLETELQNQLPTQLEQRLYTQLKTQLWEPERNYLAGEISSQLPPQQVIDERNGEIRPTLGKHLSNCIQPELWAAYGSLLDFCISVLNLPHFYGRNWIIFQSIVRDCGWIYPYDKVCIICEKPIALSADSNYRLHAEGAPAVQFADGVSIYAYHGVILPEWYGRLHPHQWQSKWVLKEQNAEVRRALIQGITYDRICQELAVTELDSWQEYTLLSIEFDDDFDWVGNAKPVYLLKMTCPSTGHIHALRVPPDVRSSSRASLTALEAIRWVNWGIEPEEFSVQT
ncbi:DUF6745 domain-containing protein [Microcoleus vaginatus]|uniref:DUF6745 domain-containing protein n=1 Tax=Microcoleus vaginatus TaxID=119532 RepID=UPI001689F40A|nr:hypothetical protein [Microcoleus sp. FACHB-84]MBD2011111.1 hypothetical protein [Microcoleus sp. FACHB-45]